MISFIVCALSLTIYENIEKDSLEKWVVSDWKKDVEQNGNWEVVSSVVDGIEHNYLKTVNDSRFFTISKKFETFSNYDKNFSFYYVTSNTQNIQCGGSYIKLFPSTVIQSKLKGGENEDKYNIMFGPDVCGSTKKVHLIMSHKDKNLQNNKNINYQGNNEYSMLGFTIFKDQTYSVTINENVVEKGSIKDDYPTPPKTIDDETDKKPDDWVNEQYIPDENDVKPEGWDDIPETISDPDATIPENWNEEDDGVWEPPTIKNPDWKGEWKQKMIDNPDYKGVWSPRQVSNPYFDENDVFGTYSDNSIVAVEVWQVTAGTVFGKFILTDDGEKLEEYKKNTLEYIEKHNAIINLEKNKVNEDPPEKTQDDDEKNTEEENTEEEEEEKDEL